ncbi:MAG: ComF family protein [Psychromonas sp.]|nr:ComF family protein [Psychromonas sp.]
MALNRDAEYCGDCLQKKYLFNHIHALGDYSKPLSTLIKQLKYQQQLIAGELLAYLLIKSIRIRYTATQLTQFDYLLAVPLHPKKLQQRGFNQAQIICDCLHQKLHIPKLVGIIQRKKDTIAQEGLSVKKREKNLNEAFSFNSKTTNQVKGKNIVIIDDVVTTGATINNLCKLLIKKGANSVIVFCISRTAIDN